MKDNLTKFLSNKNNVIGLLLTMYALILYVCISTLSLMQSIIVLACVFILNTLNYIIGMKDGIMSVQVKSGVLERAFNHLKNLEVERRRKKMEKDKDASIKE